MLLETTAAVLGPSGDATGLELVDDLGRSRRDPAVVLVSNNPYSLEPPRAPGTRPTLESGRLGIVVLERPPAGQRPGRTWTATHLEVHASAALHAGVDGEAIDMSPPLRFDVKPGALRVRIASGHARARPPQLP
jgi:hypothetical protein